MHVIMYHRVLESPQKNTHGVTVEEFNRQIDILTTHLKPISSEELVSLATKKTPPKENSFHLTFDDGTKDHYTLVSEILDKKGITASFFPVLGPITEKKVNTLEKQRYLQYEAFSDYKEFLNQFLHFASSSLNAEAVKIASQKAKHYLNEHSFYSDDERLFRYIRNEILKPQEFALVIDAMFEKAGINEREFIENNFLTKDEITKLSSAGHTIGGHTWSHVRLPEQDPNRQIEEISLAHQALETLLKKPVTSFAYPFGDFTLESKNFLSESNIKVSFITANRLCLPSDEWQLIPRLDASIFSSLVFK